MNKMRVKTSQLIVTMRQMTEYESTESDIELADIKSDIDDSDHKPTDHNNEKDDCDHEPVDSKC